MKKKIVSIVVCMLLFVTVSSVTGATNINKACSVSLGTRQTLYNPTWSDNFDSYSLYQFLDGTPDDGGWKGWDDDPTFGAYVTNNQSLSSPHSVDIVGATDLVHEFSGYGSGHWNFTAWVYVPGDFNGNSYFILLSDYTDGAGQNNKWAIQLRMDSGLQIIESEFDALSLDLITDEWVEIRVEIDLETDWFQCYYGGDLLIEKAWTAGPNNLGDGFINIAAVDLFANGATSVYYDDLSLEGEAGTDPDLLCEGELVWINVTSGDTLQGNFTVENVGGGASLLDWEITKEPSWGTWTFDPDGGDDLPPGTTVTVQVTCVAPDKKNEEFYGKIKVENMENPDDVCYIDVTLTTPVNKPSLVLQFFERLIQRFPLLERILSLHLL